MSSGNAKVALGAVTRRTLIRKARRLFRRGYDAVGTPEIAVQAGVTRGALYHHFKDKRDLFAAVVEAVAADVVDRINKAAASRQPSPVDAVVSGSRAFIEACADDETRRILLLDAPAVLGWAEWRAIDARHGLGSLKQGLAACAASGCLDQADIDAVAHLLSGALNEAVFLLADRPYDRSLARRVDRCMQEMIHALLAPQK